MSFIPDAFPLINGGDSPTKGQHRIFLQPGGRGLLYADVAGVSASSKHPAWAWALLQYLIGHTKDDQWLGATNMASLAISPYPRKAVGDSKIKELWTQFFGDLDAYFRALDTSVALPQLLSIAREAWYPKWTDFVVARLQDCLAGKISADRACDAMADNIKQERGR